MGKKINFKQFAKFFWGVASEKEKKQVYNSKASDEMLKKHWNDLEASQNEEKSTTELFSKISNDKEKSIPIFTIGRLSRVAAVMILLLAVGTVLYLFTDHPYQFLTQEVEYTVHENPKGQRSQIVLPDGSLVWLNSDSKLSYAEDFSNVENRNIKLEGEAYFDVKHNSEKPFVVSINDIKVKVLGTRFNIRGFNENNEINTLLVSGKVAISNQTNSIKKQLSPGSMGIYSKKEKKLEIKSGIDIEKNISWKNGKLIFDNEPLLTLVKELERWYGVSFEIPESLKGKYRYTITITDESVPEVCELIKRTTPISYTIKGNKVYFNPNE
jgi:ferric-dicitrate binding protein FerR (iron transport regulator)